MRSLTNPEPTSRVEGALRTLYGGPAPDAAFVDGLERRLLERAQALPSAPTYRRPWVWAQAAGRHPWAMAALALLLALATALTAIGPQRVWAQVQRLLGYVPGVGFVDLESTRVLTAPVALTREGVTLVVEQALARPQGTTVVIRSEGLPREDELRAAGRELAEGCEARLRLPGGETLTPRTYSAELGAATFEFAPLPEGVYQVTLELPRLPLTPDGVAPEGWEAPITLRPATGELVAELYPQPYAPEGAVETHDGVTVRVLQVAHSSEETEVRLQVQWEVRDWEFYYLDSTPTLRDDVGHSYFWPATPGSGSTVQTEVIVIDPSQAQPAPTPAVPTHEETVPFSPLSSLARRLTLELDAVTFEVRTEASIEVDLGDDPRVGDYWPLDVSLQVAGFPVHVTGARLAETVVGAGEAVERRRELRLEIAPVPAQGKRTLAMIGLDGGSRIGLDGGSSGYTPGTNRIRASVAVKEGEAIPQGRVQVWVRSASIRVAGPWRIAWDVPGEHGKGDVAPVTLHPQAARQQHSGLTLQVDEVVRTDRLTSIKVAASGEALSLLPYRDLAGRGHGALLYDDRGGRYEMGRGATGWDPGGPAQPRPGRYVFGPVDPLARRLTLRLPGAQVVVPGQAAFEVEVPAGPAMAPISAERPGVKSAPWEVDIPLEVAGYGLRFREAWLEESSGSTMLWLLSEPYTPAAKDRWLSALRPAAMKGPDGRTRDLRGALDSPRVEAAFSSVVAAPGGGAERQAVLAIELADPETGEVRPGVYHVELEGCYVAVRGPWELTWEVGGG